MEDKPEWRAHLVLSLILIGQSFIDWSAPEGPWQAKSFTVGVIAMVGLGFLYSAKYRWQFGRTGVIPYLNNYQCDDNKIAISSLVEAAIAIGFVVVLNSIPDGFVSTPVPAALLILLYASLMMLHALYAWLVCNGPLRDDEEE